MRLFCKKCETEKSIDRFGKDKSRPSGYYPWCRDCTNTYIKARRNRNLVEVPTVVEKFCPKCKTPKPANDFHRNKYQFDGLKPWCKKCDLSHKKTIYQSDSKRDAYYIRNYGITLEQYRELELRQDYKCAICKEVPEHNLAVDHCHETGEVRGLLCKACNVGIGNLGDSIERLQSAIEYLESSMYNLRR